MNKIAVFSDGEATIRAHERHKLELKLYRWYPTEPGHDEDECDICEKGIDKALREATC